MRKALAVCLLLAIVLAAAAPGAAAQAPPPDFDLPVSYGAHFFAEAGGAAGVGYAVSNADGITFWDVFRRAGGVPAVGYPVSDRFVDRGFVVQAMQKVVFQWSPEDATVRYLNVLDELHDAGFDPYLQSTRQIPPPSDWSSDAGRPWDQVVQRHLALLSANSAIAAAYFADPNPLGDSGLPMAPVQDMGGVLVLRAQRKVFQPWLTDRPWAKAREVTVANGGDIAKEAGLYPAAAVVPEPAETAPLGVGGAATVPTATPTTTPDASPTPTASPAATPTPQPACNGDEAITFSPPNPVVGDLVYVNATSARGSTDVALDGPLSPAAAGVQTGGLGFVWSWTVTPTGPGEYDEFTIHGIVCASANLLVGGAPVTAYAT